VEAEAVEAEAVEAEAVEAEAVEAEAVEAEAVEAEAVTCTRHLRSHRTFSGKRVRSSCFASSKIS
jgi:hypothetical protein